MRRTLVIPAILAILAATVLPVSAQTALPDEALEPSAITWRGPIRTDPTGDGTLALNADIVRYRMSYDGATHEHIVDIWFDGAPTFNPWFVGVVVDLDRDRRTGCDGSDWQLQVSLDGTEVVRQYSNPRPDCDSTIFDEIPVTAAYDADAQHLHIPLPTEHLDGAVSLDWYVRSMRTNPGGAVGEDRAPDGIPSEMVSDFGWVRPFPDVRTDAFYGGPVAWLRQAGLTTGVGTTGNYLPENPLTRAEMATFLWRIGGEEPAPPAAFVDVQRPSFYAAAVDWLAAEGLTTGVGGSNRYEPHGPITRGQMVTFLWRLAGEPAGYPDPGFSDVTNAGAFYYEAVAFARAEGLTTGVGGTDQFRPDDVVTRGQLATFLERFYAPLGLPGYVP